MNKATLEERLLALFSAQPAPRVVVLDEKLFVSWPVEQLVNMTSVVDTLLLQKLRASVREDWPTAGHVNVCVVDQRLMLWCELVVVSVKAKTYHESAAHKEQLRKRARLPCGLLCTRDEEMRAALSRLVGVNPQRLEKLMQRVYAADFHEREFTAIQDEIQRSFAQSWAALAR